MPDPGAPTPPPGTATLRHHAAIRQGITNVCVCGELMDAAIHGAPRPHPGEPLAHALNHLAATLTDIQTRLNGIDARLGESDRDAPHPCDPEPITRHNAEGIIGRVLLPEEGTGAIAYTADDVPQMAAEIAEALYGPTPGVWTVPGERGPEPVVLPEGAGVDPARSPGATFVPADAPGADGTPAWAYDEDGYCVACGNGRWKHHMPGCELRDALDAVDREAPPPDGAPTEAASCGAELAQGCNVTGNTHRCHTAPHEGTGWRHECECGTQWPNLAAMAACTCTDAGDMPDPQCAMHAPEPDGSWPR